MHPIAIPRPLGQIDPACYRHLRDDSAFDEQNSVLASRGL